MMKRYVFTFGSAHRHGDRAYIEVVAKDWGQARDAVFAQYGKAWAFQYEDNAETKAMIEEHGLTCAVRYIVVDSLQAKHDSMKLALEAIAAIAEGGNLMELAKKLELAVDIAKIELGLAERAVA